MNVKVSPARKVQPPLGVTHDQLFVAVVNFTKRTAAGTYCGGNALSPAVKSVLAEIERGLSDPLFSLEGAIRALPLNYDYVRKLFRREVGATPLEYLTSARMERAAAIILSGVQNRYSNYTVAQIAEMCGYLEPLYFSRVFKNYYGLSPSQYIERARRGR